MAKEISKDLFHLIKSLSKSEKRFFKLTASRRTGGDGTNYIKLFDAVDRQKKEYDERKIVQQEKSIRPERLADMKNHLYEVILKNLSVYHTNKTLEAKLKNMLHYIEILYEKGLYDQCRKLIIKAKQTAGKHESHLYLLHLLVWEINLMRSQSYFGTSEKNMIEIFAELFETTEKFKNVYDYEHLASKLFIKWKKKGYSRTSSDTTEYAKIINDPLLKNESNALSYPARLSLYFTYSAYFSLQNDFIKSYRYAQKTVQLLEDHPHQAEEKTKQYIAALNNLIIEQFNLKRYAEIPVSIKKLRAVSIKSKGMRDTVFLSTNNFELGMYISTGEFEKGLNLVTDIEKELDNKEGIQIMSKEHETILYHNIFQIYFGAGQYSKAIGYLNKILNDTTIDLRNDILCFARILNLITHFELRHMNLLEYVVKSTYYFLNKRKRLYKFETSVLDFIRKKLPKVITEKELIKAFKELKTEFEEITKDAFEKKALEYFDFISWLESKIEGRPFAEIVKKKGAKAIPSQI